MENKTLGILLAGFIALIVGVSLIAVVATEEQKVTTPAYVQDEALDISSARDAEQNYLTINESVGFVLDKATTNINAWKLDSPECGLDQAPIFTNGSRVFVEGIDYTINATGNIGLKDTYEMNTSVINATTISYTYCGEDYLTEGWTRSILDIVIGFFGIALMLVSVGIFWQVAKEEGILNI